MTSSESDLHMQMERASLLPGRYYIILRPAEEDTFSMTAYSTSPVDGEIDEDNFDVASIIQMGIIDLIERNTPELFERGLHVMNERVVAEAILEDDDSERAKAVKEGNVIKVDFGRKQ